MCTFARAVSAAHDKNRNSFSARGNKKVAQHWFIWLGDKNTLSFI